MAYSSVFRLAKPIFIAALALALVGCGLKKPDAVDTSKASWRVGRIETASNARVTNGESMGSRVALGILGGPVGLALAAGTEKDLGTSSIWQYDIRDGAALVRVQSFSVVAVGDCVQFASDAPAGDIPIERLPAERCPATK